MLTRISTGIIIAKNGAPDGIGKILKWASYGIAVMLLALDFAHFGMREKFNGTYYDKDYFDRSQVAYSPSASAVHDLTQSRQIDFAFRVLVFVLSLAMVGRSIMVKLQTRGEAKVSTVSSTTS